jgi:large subunit ribosomal protein L31
MRENIHPPNSYAKIECACGTVIETRSTRGSYKIDICSNCHPFYTGKQKLVDTEGRVQRFNRKYGKATPAA